MSKNTQKIDLVFVAAAVSLIIIGVVMATCSAVFSLQTLQDPYYFFKKQIFVGLLPGLILLFAAFKIPLYYFKKWAPFLLFANLIVLAMVFIPGLGIRAGGAVRWINLGFISFQPSEFLKISFILYLAAWLGSYAPAKKVKKANHLSLGVFAIVSAIIILLLYKQPNISTLFIILAIGLVVYFLADTLFIHTIMLAVIGSGLFIFFINSSYRLDRLRVLLQPGIEPMGIGYQIKQSLITIGSGGFWGVGLGMSQQKYGFLPQSMSDAIFAIFAEETGFLGAAILVGLFLVLFWRGITIAQSSQDKFCQLTAIGITFWICFQALLNIAAISGIIPLSGIPLPFLSYGSSHLIAELIGIGIILNISQNKRSII